MDESLNLTIKDLTGSLLKSVLITPLYIGDKSVGSLIIGSKRKKRIQDTMGDYLSALNSVRIAEAIKKVAGFEVWEKAKLITAGILDYRINMLRGAKKNPDIIVDLLLKVFNVYSLLIIRTSIKSGYVYYYAEIDKKGNITFGETGPFKGNNFISILEDKKVDKNYKFLRRSADAKTFLNATVAP
jgi:hypothetical protein